MTTHWRIQDAGRSRYLLFNEDGLLDILVGLVLVCFALFLFAGMPWLVAILPTTLGPAWFAAKRLIVAPRIDSAEVSEETRARVRWVLSAFVVLGVLLLGLVAAWVFSRDLLPVWLRAHPGLLTAGGFGLPIAMGLAVGAASMGLTRYYAYAAAVLAGFGGGYLLGWEVWWMLVTAGAAVAAGGTAALIRFVRDHPVR